MIALVVGYEVLVHYVISKRPERANCFHVRKFLVIHGASFKDCCIHLLTFSCSVSGLLPLGGAGKYRPKPTAIVTTDQQEPGNQRFEPFYQQFLNAERRKNIHEFIWTIYVGRNKFGYPAS